MPSTPRRRSARPSADERATTLVLVPAMTLVVMALGAVAVDLSLLHAAHRDVHRVVSAAADDASAVLDERELQVSGRVVIDPVGARGVAEAHLAAARLPGELVGPVDVRITDDRTSIEVKVVVDVPHVLLRSAPGADERRLRVAARGRLHP